METQAHPALSVIVPTRDRPDRLRDCLASLARQRIAPGAMEVVVVDDGSLVPVEGSVRLTPGQSVRWLRQPPSGLSVARNAGVEAATADVLAFLDDDTLVDPGWAAAIVDGFADPACDGLAGRVLLRYEGPVPRWLRDPAHGYLSGFDAGDEPHWLTGAYPFGANCAVRRLALEQVGGFRSRLGRSSGSLLSGEETDFFKRVSDRGGRLRYWPAAVVEHRVPAERLQPAWFEQRSFAQGVSDALIEGFPRSRSEKLARLLLVLRRLARTPLILAKGLALARSPVSARIWLAYCRGLVHGSRPSRGGQRVTEPPTEFESALRALDVSLFEHVDGQTTQRDRRSLLALQNASRSVYGSFGYLEIGSHLGGSLQALVRDPRCASIVSIDARPERQPDDRGLSVEYPENSTRRMLAGLASVPDADLTKLRTIDASTEDLQPAAVEETVHLCLIDGEHTHGAALRDARFCSETLRGEGCIAFHDRSVVFRAIGDFLAELQRDGRTWFAYPMADHLFVVELGVRRLAETEWIRRVRGGVGRWIWRPAETRPALARWLLGLSVHRRGLRAALPIRSVRQILRRLLRLGARTSFNQGNPD